MKQETDSTPNVGDAHPLSDPAGRPDTPITGAPSVRSVIVIVTADMEAEKKSRKDGAINIIIRVAFM